MLNLYKMLWSRLGGRPWTYILRDIYHCGEWLIIVILLVLGAALGKALSWLQVALALGIFTIGYIGGHLFWGTKYIPGQPGNGNEEANNNGD